MNTTENDRFILEPKRKRVEKNQEDNNNGPEHMITEELATQIMDNLDGENVLDIGRDC